MRERESDRSILQRSERSYENRTCNLNALLPNGLNWALFLSLSLSLFLSLSLSLSLWL